MIARHRSVLTIACALAGVLLLFSCRKEPPSPVGQGHPPPTAGASDLAGTAGPTAGGEIGATAAGVASANDDNAWVARLDGVPLSAGEARRMVVEDSRLLHQLATVSSEKVLRQAVEGWVWETIQAKEAEKRGLARKAKPEIDIERDLVTRYYYIKHLGRKIVVSDAEVKALLPNPLARLRVTSRTFADEVEAGNALGALRSGKVKWEESGEPLSGGSGGSWVWPYPNSGFLDKIQSDLVFTLKKGDLSPVLKTGLGYLILRVEERDNLSGKRIARLKDTFRAQVRNEKVAKVVDQWRSSQTIARMDKDDRAEFTRLVAASIGLQGGRPPEKIIASVGGWNLGFNSLQHVAGKFAGFREKMGVTEKVQFLSSVLDSLITARVIAAGAAQSGYTLDKEVEKELEQRKKGMLAAALIDELETSDRNVTEKDAREYFEANREAFRNRRLVRASHILLMNLKEAEDVYRSISAGNTSFRQAEKTFSADETVGAGGDIGWVYPGRLVPELEAAVLSLKVGDISPPVRSRYGFHLMTVTEVREEKDVPFDVAKGEIIEKLSKMKRERKKSDFLKEVRKNYKIEYDKRNLTALMARLDAGKEELFLKVREKARGPHTGMGTQPKKGVSPPHGAH